MQHNADIGLFTKSSIFIGSTGRQDSCPANSVNLRFQGTVSSVRRPTGPLEKPYFPADCPGRKNGPHLHRNPDSKIIFNPFSPEPYPHGLFFHIMEIGMNGKHGPYGYFQSGFLLHFSSGGLANIFVPFQMPAGDTTTCPHRIQGA